MCERFAGSQPMLARSHYFFLLPIVGATDAVAWALLVRPTRPTCHLSPAKVPLGPIRSIETFASPLHCAPSGQVALIAETPLARVSDKRQTRRLPRLRAEVARF